MKLVKCNECHQAENVLGCYVAEFPCRDDLILDTEFVFRLADR